MSYAGTTDLAAGRELDHELRAAAPAPLGRVPITGRLPIRLTSLP